MEDEMYGLAVRGMSVLEYEVSWSHDDARGPLSVIVEGPAGPRRRDALARRVQNSIGTDLAGVEVRLGAAARLASDEEAAFCVAVAALRAKGAIEPLPAGSRLMASLNLTDYLMPWDAVTSPERGLALACRELARTHPGTPLVTSSWAYVADAFGVEVLGYDYLCEGAAPATVEPRPPAAAALEDRRPFERVACSQTAMLAALVSAASRSSLLLDHKGHQAQAALRLSRALAAFADAGCLEGSREPAALLAADAAGTPRDACEVPFEIAYANTTLAELLGGGRGVTPGLMSRAAGGVLWLPELARMDGRTVERAAQAAKEGLVRLAHIRGTYAMPADTRLVGLLGEGERMPPEVPPGRLFDLRCEVAGEDGPAALAWLEAWGHGRPQDLTLGEARAVVGATAARYGELFACESTPLESLRSGNDRKTLDLLDLLGHASLEKAARAAWALAGLRDDAPRACDTRAALEIALLGGAGDRGRCGDGDDLDRGMVREELAPAPADGRHAEPERWGWA